MSCSANRVTSFHRRLVEDILDAEGGERLVGVGRRRQVVQRTSPPVLHCITFGHFFWCHHWLCAEFVKDLVENIRRFKKKQKTSDAIEEENKKSHNSFLEEVQQKNKPQRHRGENEEKEKSYSKMGCLQSVDPRYSCKSAGVRCLLENGEVQRVEDY